MITMKCTFLIFTILAILSCGLITKTDADMYEVHVIDALPGNLPLTIHCQDKESDFGFLNLTVGQDFHWNFPTELFKKKQYWCHFWWAGRDKVFDVFYEPHHERCELRIPERVGNWCYWQVREDGFYFTKYPPPVTSMYRKMYDW